MLTSIPVKEFVDPPRGSRPYNAIVRAIDLKPDVQLIGKFRTGKGKDAYWERYYRVQSPKRSRHCVIIWQDENGQSARCDEVAKCDCESHYIPHEPQPCVHVAAALIWESQNNGKPARASRQKGSNAAHSGSKRADQKQRPPRRRV